MATLLELLGLSMYALFLLGFSAFALFLETITRTTEFLFSNWIIQAIFGSWVAFEFQRRSQAVQETKTQRANKRSAMQQTHAELFQLVDQRLSASQIYLDSLTTGNEAEIEESRRLYAEIVHSWNTYGPRRISDAVQYFPSKQVYRFEDDVYNAFPVLESWLRFSRVEGLESDFFESAASTTQVLIDELKVQRNKHSSIFLKRINSVSKFRPTLHGANESWATIDLLRVLFGLRTN